ncbi:hypothetical protein D3C78_1620060 [compost metagenome]
MFGTEVWKVSGSTFRRPRLSASSPQAERLSVSVAPTRPAANSTVSALRTRPLPSETRHLPLSSRSTFSAFWPKISFMLRSRS